MRKLIETEQKILVTCDNPNCDYEVPCTDENRDSLRFYINEQCPECGENLLTIEDYLQHQKIMKAVNFINRWFSWITIFYSRKATTKTVSVYVHDGIKIKQE